MWKSKCCGGLVIGQVYDLWAICTKCGKQCRLVDSTGDAPDERGDSTFVPKRVETEPCEVCEADEDFYDKLLMTKKDIVAMLVRVAEKSMKPFGPEKAPTDIMSLSLFIQALKDELL